MARVVDIPLGLSFDDVLLVPQYSEIGSRTEVSTRSKLVRDIYIEAPIIASNMDTVTESEMGIALARVGGFPIIHRFLTIEAAVAEARRVKKYRAHVIDDPVEITADKTIGDAIASMRQHEIGGLMVVDEQRRLIGIITNRDIYSESRDRLVSEVMTPRERMVIGRPGMRVEEASELMHEKRIEKLPLVDDATDHATGLIVMKDIRKLQDYPKASLDGLGRLLVGSSVGITGDYFERAEELIKVGSDVIAIDIAHGHSKGAIEATRKIHNAFPDTPLIVGDVASSEGVMDLAKAGADAVRAGIGPGCFEAGTRVLMANGTYKNIESVVVGDRVINMHGHPVNVVGARCTGKRRTISYRHSAHYLPTRVTADHLHWIGDLDRLNPKTITGKGYVASLEMGSGEKYKWRPIGEIRQDVFLSPRQIDFELPKKIEVNLEDFTKHLYTLKRYKTRINESYDLGYMLGFFLGDGCSHITPNKNSEAGSVHFYLGRDETHLLEKLTDAVEDVTGVRPTAKLTEKGNLYILSLYSLQWARLLGEFGKKTEKHLPERYYCSSPEYLSGLFHGLVDSDGYYAADGRVCFVNTSPQLIELFNMLCYLNEGSFPNTGPKGADADACGGLQGAKLENMAKSFTSRLNISHKKRLNDDYQLIKGLEIDYEESGPVDVYDIEVDCPTHSFIANNVIVHNSACATRVVAGTGYPQLSALLDCAEGARKAGVALIADGGIKNSADLCKALGAGADTVILGSLLAGTPESPGKVVLDERGNKFKRYRGMASLEALMDKKLQEGTSEEEFEETNMTAAEGVETLIPLKEPVDKIIHQLLGGLRSGMSYSNAHTVDEFHEKVRFVQMTTSGAAESRPHILER